MLPDASILSASAALPLGHRMLKTIQAILMWFKTNGHVAKNEESESEVSHECSKNQTTFYQ